MWVLNWLLHEVNCYQSIALILSTPRIDLIGLWPSICYVSASRWLTRIIKICWKIRRIKYSHRPTSAIQGRKSNSNNSNSSNNNNTKSQKRICSHGVQHWKSQQTEREHLKHQLFWQLKVTRRHVRALVMVYVSTSCCKCAIENTLFECESSLHCTKVVQANTEFTCNHVSYLPNGFYFSFR